MNTDQLIASLKISAREADGLYLYDTERDTATGPYLDWSTQSESGVQLEAGDGADSVQIKMTWDQLADLHRHLTVTLLNRQP